MAFRPIVVTNISLDTTAVTRAGFGTALFIDDHFWFTERVRSYTSLTAAAADFPTTSDAYRGVAAAFANQVDPTIVKVGRRQADSIVFTPEAVTAAGQVYTLAVVGTNGTTVTATFTSVTGSETAANVTAALTTGLSGLVGVTVTDGTGTLTLAKSGTEDFSVNGNTLARLTFTTTVTETAANVMAAITAVDDDFYFVAASDHTDTFVQAMSLDVESRTKQYFVAVQEVASLGAYSDSATDILSRLRQSNRLRTASWFHHQADTTFPEMTFITVASPNDPGKKIWANNRVTVEVSENPTTGLRLSATEKTNLVNKNASFIENVGGVAITRRGTVVGSATTLISDMRNADFLVSEITANYQSFLINTPVVPYTDSGITRAGNVLESTLDRYVTTETQPNILQERNPYTVTLPDRRNVSQSDVANGLLTIPFVGRLAGSIREITITGNLIFEAQS